MKLRLRTLQASFFHLLITFLLAGATPALYAASTVHTATASPPAPATAPPRVLLTEFHDTLQPERANVFIATLERARSEHVSAILIDFSSPGGMSAPTDRMVAAMRRSTVPIIVWVSGGSNSRVSGEALRIMAEADVILMSRADYLTPLWTETPRRLSAAQRLAGSQRLTHELAQSITAHGRSPSAIDELASGIHWFNATEALQAGLIDGIVDKQEDVYRFVSQHGYNKNGTKQHLNLTGARLVYDTPSPQSAMLLALMNPNLSVLFLTLGLLLVYLEINTPGVVIPGAVGVLLLLLAIYSLFRLPLDRTGIFFCVLAIVLLLLETRARQHGLCATAAVVTLVFGLGRLVDAPVPQLQVSWGTAFGAGVGFGGVTAALLILGIRARQTKVRTGADAMLGWLAVAQTPLAPEGQVLVRGELWPARLTSHDSAVAAGDHVKVLRADGLVLEVTAVPIAPSA